MDYYEGGIDLDIDDLVIDGNGKTIDGGNKSRIFIVTGKNITLRNIIFKNGYVFHNSDKFLNGEGGAIKANHNTDLKIENCEFISNESEYEGGAISVSFSGLKIKESSFSKNKAEYGGAIYINNADVCIKESLLNYNISSNYGGAIYCDKGKLNIIESTLNENIGEWGGGAIYISNAELCIKESTLNGNSSLGRYKYKGAAIHNNKGSLTISDSMLSGNSTNEGGGAINNYEHNRFTESDCEFTNNRPKDIAFNNWSTIK